MSLFEGTGKIPATVMEARYSLMPSEHVCGLQQVADKYYNISMQYFSEALLLEQIPPCPAKTESGEHPYVTVYLQSFWFSG